MIEKANSDWDYWIGPRESGRAVDIHTTPDNHVEIEQIMRDIKIDCNVMISNLQTLINDDNTNNLLQKSNSSSIMSTSATFFQNYQTWQTVYSYLDSLVAEFPTYARLSTIGSTYLGKSIKIITLSTNPNTGKPTLFFGGGIHARYLFLQSFIHL